MGDYIGIIFRGKVVLEGNFQDIERKDNEGLL